MENLMIPLYVIHHLYILYRRGIYALHVIAIKGINPCLNNIPNFSSEPIKEAERIDRKYTDFNLTYSSYLDKNHDDAIQFLKKVWP